MNLHMTAKVSPIVEVFATNSASSGELTCPSVYRHVVLEVAKLRETLATLAAAVPRGGCMTLHVTCQRFIASKYLEHGSIFLNGYFSSRESVCKLNIYVYVHCYAQSTKYK